MTTTLDRLRRLQGLRSKRTAPEPADLPPQPRPGPSAAPVPGTDAPPAPIERLEPGELLENRGGEIFAVTRRYPLNDLRGQTQMGSVLARDVAALAGLYPAYGLEDCAGFRRAAFLDTETSGLGGGASVYAFLVGVGRFEPLDTDGDGTADGQAFVIRQFFMRHPGEEPALLTALAELLQECDSLVTFNGRSFDAPLLRGRYRYAGRFLPAGVETPPALADSAAHLDLLHPARRLWKKRLPSCALSSLERSVLRHPRTEADVPGSLIPQLYTDYLRQGDGRQMQRVFYHNREDIASMAALAEVICAAFDEPESSPAGVPQADGDRPAGGHPADLLSRARLHWELGRLASAETLFRAALDRLPGRNETEQGLLAEAFDGLGRLLKRQERWQAAAGVWQQWLTTVPDADVRPYVELAKFCEWQTQDWEQAAMWTQWALHEQETAPARARSQQTLAELRHRLARLRRKLGEGPAG